LIRLEKNINGLIFAGRNAGRAEKMVSVAQLMAELVQ
jgi:hypothetical protein